MFYGNNWIIGNVSYYSVTYHNSEVELIKTKFEMFGVVEYV